MGLGGERLWLDICTPPTIIFNVTRPLAKKMMVVSLLNVDNIFGRSLCAMVVYCGIPVGRSPQSSPKDDLAEASASGLYVSSSTLSRDMPSLIFASIVIASPLIDKYYGQIKNVCWTINFIDFLKSNS